MRDRSTAVSKYLSKYLRHSPHEIGLTLLSGGWVSVEDVLKATRNHGFIITREELDSCVENNDKKRFSFSEDGLLIRANQGHSVRVDLELEQKTPPDILYHGTADRFAYSIQREGLKKGNRHHVHLSEDLITAKKVGARHGNPVYFEVDAKRMHQGNHKFYQSDNGVWLVEYVPTEFIVLKRF